MQQFEYKITYPVGLHARPSLMLVKAAKKFKSDVLITRKLTDKTADAKSTMAIMRLGIISGEMAKIEVSGEDEDIAVKQLQEFFESTL